MNKQIKEVSNAVLLMEKHLNDNLHEQKLWKNTYIKEQIEKREKGERFALSDHMRAMVYSMLSAEKEWYIVQQHIDNGEIDTIFKSFCADELLECNADTLTEQVKNKHCGSRLTSRQMKALIDVNINRLVEIEKQHESIDDFYQRLLQVDRTYKVLLTTLSDTNSPYKLNQMGEALVTEYLKNVGYDICKPDRHICRILGCDVLGCSDEKEVPIYEALDIVSAIADELHKPIAEVDYILWSYCANGYGEICTVNKPKCDKCVVREYCKKKKGD